MAKILVLVPKIKYEQMVENAVVTQNMDVNHENKSVDSETEDITKLDSQKKTVNQSNKAIDNQQNNDEIQMVNPKLIGDLKPPMKPTRKSTRQQKGGRLSIKRTPNQFIKQMKHSKWLSFKV